MVNAKLSSPRHTDQTALEPGALVAGKYRLESLIGKGGMGEVWVATNLVLESRVAIKVLLSSLQQHEEAAQRLLREARAAARISHRNIVQVFDFGHIESGQPFIVMELLRGESLGDRLERAIRLPAIQAVEIVVPVAHALSTAHAKGIIHRDLKPWNIFLAVDESNTETPKVVDFGIAKVTTAHASRVTIDGHVLGSPEYLSPEQALGEPDIDVRADIWALSVTLYETMTGRLPFEDPSYNRLLRKIVEDEPVPTIDHAAGDASLWDIVRKGLAKKREERWQTAVELGSALEQWLESHDVHSTAGTFRRTFEPGEGAALALTDEDLDEELPGRAVVETRRGPPLGAENADTRRGAPLRKRSPLVPVVAAVGALIGVAAAALVAFRSAPKAEAQAAGPEQAVEQAASASGPTPPLPIASSAPAPSAAPISSAADPIPSISAPASTRTTAPARTGPAPARTGSKKGPVPAIPAEPNF